MLQFPKSEKWRQIGWHLVRKLSELEFYNLDLAFVVKLILA